MTTGPVLSIVDYAAWEKGYMPPSEHVLIDQLSYRGARVVMSSDMGDSAYWLVVRGTKLSGRVLLAVKRAIEDAIEALEDGGKVPQRFTILNDGPSRFVLCDIQSEEPAPVYETAEEAQAALSKLLLK